MADRSSWSHYATVTTNTALISGTSTSVVGYLDLSNMDATFFSNAKADGSDIVIVPSGETTDVNKLPRELVGFSTATSVGELFFGPITVTSASSTSWDVWVGNASGAETNSTSVWSDYVQVYHLAEDPSGSAPQMYNSATGTYDGTSAGSMTSGDSVAGKMGDALDFDSGNDYISTPSYTTGSQYDISVWANRSDNNIGGYVAKRNPGNEWQLYCVSGTTLSFIAWSASPGSADWSGYVTAVPTGTWHHCRGTYDGAGGHYLYVNDVLRGTGNATGATVNTAAPIRIGNDHYASYYGGKLDEVRIRGTIMSADEASTEYAQQNSPSTFWTYGSTTAVGGVTEDQIDSFEDDNFTADPAWTVTAGSWTVTSTDSKNGTYSLKAGDGGGSDIEHDHGAGQSITPGTFQSWVKIASTTGYCSARYMIYDSGGDNVFAEYMNSGAGGAFRFWRNTSGATTSWNPTLGEWYKFVIEFFSDGTATAWAEDGTGTKVASFGASTYSHALNDYQVIRLSSFVQVGDTGYSFDDVQYEQQGTTSEATSNALFFGAGA